ncbi:MAG TPA: hypothetical protein VGI23_12395 [Steroidobacteraceae bacterium]|jgi:hypothetical protein
MKRFAGMLAVALATAAQSQTPTSDQAPTPAAMDATSQAPIAAPNTGAAPASEPTAARESTAAQVRIAPAADTLPANAAQANVEKADVAQAATYLKTAAADFTNCRRASACKTYFDSFGVAIPFADGSIVPFSHVQRLSATSRECVKKAKALEEEGNRSLAVQWAMAARIENRTIRDWLGSHPDAVLEALRQVTVL